VLIAKTSAVLVEVSLSDSAYVGSTRFDQILETLRDSGLVLCALGVDPVTFDGNALFVRRSAASGAVSACDTDRSPSPVFVTTPKTSHPIPSRGWSKIVSLASDSDR